jgi:hypothetical protein
MTTRRSSLSERDYRKTWSLQGGTGGGCTANDPLPFPVEVDDAVWSIPPVSSITRK